MGRFTKAAAVAELQGWADDIEAKCKFDVNNGTAQLLPRGASESMKALIDRAVEYGRMRAFQRAASDIESGHLGVSNN